MRIIHGTSYSENDREKFKPAVIHNLLDSVYCLVNAMREVFDQEFENQSNDEMFEELIKAQMVLEDSPNDLTSWNANAEIYANCVSSIWDDSAVKLTYEQRNKFFLNDSSE